MKVLKVKKGGLIAKRQEKVMEWYLIQEGSVECRFSFVKIVMKRNSIIGILDTGWFSCDYVAREDTTVITIPCKNAQDLSNILAKNENFRPVFLRTAIEQRQQALCLYVDLYRKVRLLHAKAEEFYNDYKNRCSQLLVDEQPFARMECFEALNLQHRAEEWEVRNSDSLVKNYLREYMQLMIKDDNLCVGAIMEASAQMHRVTLGIGEMVNYMLRNKDILFAETKDDLFHLYYDLTVARSRKGNDVTWEKEQMLAIVEVMQMLGIYGDCMEEAQRRCAGSNFEGLSVDRVYVAKEDCVARIMEYAGYANEDIHAFRTALKEQNTREVSRKFYEIYLRTFLRSTENLIKPSPIIQMFLNFGFMDAECLGEDLTNALYNLVDSIGLFQSQHVYTMYDWLLHIYNGDCVPSINEMNMDYAGALQQQLKQGNITEEQMKAAKSDGRQKVAYEIQNMFRTADRVTSGRLHDFCPVLQQSDFVGNIEKMAVTVEKIEAAINSVRCLDYSAFYREVMFTDPEHGIKQEWIMKEVLPDIILMPNVGSRALMWQETAGVKNDTPARFLFPMFTSMDMEDLMRETIARYRWEICRKIQGVYWNDLREPSLTSEYCDYMQFYRKNSELSAEAKDKIKTDLARCRNSQKEVFVKDYDNWMKYESQGSFRLNKVSRSILMKYCPFAKEVRSALMANPQYQKGFMKFEVDNERKRKKLRAMYDKYEASGAQLTPELLENMKYYEM